MVPKRQTGVSRVALHYPRHMADPVDLLTFLELPSFSRRWDGLGLEDQDMGLLQALIMVSPKKAPVISGTNGLRKMRCGRKKAGKGKSSGYRVCYVYFEEYATVLMVLIYPKNEMDDIPEGVKPGINLAIKRIEAQLMKSSYRFQPKPN